MLRDLSDFYPKAKSKPSMPSKWNGDEGGRAGRAQRWAERESTERRASCPVLLTDDSLMKRELCSSQIQTKKPELTTTEQWYLTAHCD